ncbi:DNA-binding transcription factor [Lithospermum erythrorhizon]|uniref:DNA-binding transcription factor n=1 Tax=Lithospermum erythrorhizon TaxID=34254 RepID=A0AAV3NGH3_LITER
MDNQQQAAPPPPPSQLPPSAAMTSPYPPPPPSTTTPYHHLLQQQQEQLQMFWTYQKREIDKVNDFKNHNLPLARIKKIMKADEDVRMISAEAPILFSKACELFILELTIRSWLHAEENKRRTLQKNDIAAAITRTDIFDFLVDIVPRDEIKDEGVMGIGGGVGMGGGMGVGVGVGGGMMGGVASGMPYYYPPMAPPGVMMGRHAIDPGMYGQALPPPSQAWQSVWQNGDDGSYGSGGGGGVGAGSADGGSVDQGSLDGQG